MRLWKTRGLRLLLIGGCTVPLLLGAVRASADNGPHVQGAAPLSDSCAGCHRTHAARSASLLAESSQTALCFTCHGTSGTGASTDVQDGVAYPGGPTRALRGGGFQYALIDSSHPIGQQSGFSNEDGIVPVRARGQAVNSSHSVNSSKQMIWGNGEISATPNYGTTTELRCGSCHNPHGNGQYRILRPIPDGAAAGTTGVQIADAVVKNYTTDNYWQADNKKAPSFIENISDWCSSCHTRYLASSGSATKSSGDAVYKYRHSSVAKTQGSPSCAQCHVAHGSNASMSGSLSSNVNFPNGTPGGGDSRLLRIDNRGTCQMCHNR